MSASKTEGQLTQNKYHPICQQISPLTYCDVRFLCYTNTLTYLLTSTALSNIMFNKVVHLIKKCSITNRSSPNEMWLNYLQVDQHLLSECQLLKHHHQLSHCSTHNTHRNSHNLHTATFSIHHLLTKSGIGIDYAD